MILPSVNRKEWKQLLDGTLQISLKNYFFQMKITQSKSQVQQGTVSIESAIEDLHKLCTKFIKAKNMEDDIKSIFGENLLKELEEKKKNDTLHNHFNINDILESSKYKRELHFYKNALAKTEKIIEEKNKLLVTLQEEVMSLKKENDELYDMFKEINEIKNKEIAANNINKKKKKSWYSFFEY